MWPTVNEVKRFVVKKQGLFVVFIESDIVMITFIFLQQYLRNIVEGTVPSDNMNALMQGRARGVQRLKDGAMGRAIFQYSDEEVIIIIIIITNVDDFF